MKVAMITKLVLDMSKSSYYRPSLIDQTRPPILPLTMAGGRPGFLPAHAHGPRRPLCERPGAAHDGAGMRAVVFDGEAVDVRGGTGGPPQVSVHVCIVAGHLPIIPAPRAREVFSSAGRLDLKVSLHTKSVLFMAVVKSVV